LRPRSWPRFTADCLAASSGTDFGCLKKSTASADWRKRAGSESSCSSLFEFAAASIRPSPALRNFNMNMKTKLVRFVSLMAASWLALIVANSALAQMQRSGSDYGKQPAAAAPSVAPSQATGTSGAKMATPITKEEAAKKYPPPKSGQYPTGERDPHKASGIIDSPYPPHTEYDCSKVNHGDLVLDTRVNKVFVRP
jgi:hypothetical protein